MKEGVTVFVIPAKAGLKNLAAAMKHY